MHSQAIFFFSYLGVFNGILLSIYFFFFKAKKTLSTYMLAALLLALSIRVGKSVAYFFDYQLERIYLQLGLTACVFIGPFLYFFTLAETRKVTVFPKSWKVQLSGWALVMLAVGVVYPYQQFPRYWGYVIIPLIYLQWSCYAILSIFSVIPTIKQLLKRQRVEQQRKWLIAIVGAITVILACYLWSFFNITKGSYITGALGFSIAVYLVVFAVLYKRKSADLFAPAPTKYADKKIGSADARGQLDQLIRIMSEKKLYKNPDLKLVHLAKEIGVSAHQLSQLLNDNLQKNFTLFVHEFRIDEACRLLLNQTNLSIEGIGLEVGFNSKSTFFTAFKKLKGTTPSGYLHAAASQV